jgi:hypothetical protein
MEVFESGRVGMGGKILQNAKCKLQNAKLREDGFPPSRE